MNANINAHAPAAPADDNVGAWLKILARYRQPSLARSAFELVITLVPLALFWAIAYVSFINGVWIGLLAILPAGAFLLRLFMIQHDCGHGSFFARRRLDDWTGRLIGILTLTPYDYWRGACRPPCRPAISTNAASATSPR
jgi:omega-6 fatty acid desaturase (delta-12 desaturase)